jgi:hypothetical protein
MMKGKEALEDQGDSMRVEKDLLVEETEDVVSEDQEEAKVDHMEIAMKMTTTGEVPAPTEEAYSQMPRHSPCCEEA